MVMIDKKKNEKMVNIDKKKKENEKMVKIDKKKNEKRENGKD